MRTCDVSELTLFPPTVEAVCARSACAGTAAPLRRDVSGGLDVRPPHVCSTFTSRVAVQSDFYLYFCDIANSWFRSSSSAATTAGLVHPRERRRFHVPAVTPHYRGFGLTLLMGTVV